MAGMKNVSFDTPASLFRYSRVHRTLGFDASDPAEGRINDAEAQDHPGNNEGDIHFNQSDL
ncbi:MAG: hypothetical protein AAGG44_03160 [Planctomycetota bacterium]